MARWLTAAASLAVLFPLALTLPLGAQETRGSDVCVVSGQVTSSGTPLPGVAITARSGDGSAKVTSTGIDGRFDVAVTGAAGTVTAELTGFTRVEQAIVAATCSAPLSLQLAVAPVASAPVVRGLRDVAPLKHSPWNARPLPTPNPRLIPIRRKRRNWRCRQDSRPMDRLTRLRSTAIKPTSIADSLAIDPMRWRVESSVRHRVASRAGSVPREDSRVPQVVGARRVRGPADLPVVPVVAGGLEAGPDLGDPEDAASLPDVVFNSGPTTSPPAIPSAVPRSMHLPTS